jgi:hypothetical protein
MFYSRGFKKIFIDPLQTEKDPSQSQGKGEEKTCSNLVLPMQIVIYENS